MAAFRPQNVIIFSAGKSIENGNLNIVKSFLTPEKGYNCCDWTELFTNANNPDLIALLPMLIKKIPTFDFAIILSDGTDKLKEFRNKKINTLFAKEERIMRDNVLFECGLCIMALGTDRVILLIEDKARIIEDLMGVGEIGVKSIVYNNKQKNLPEKLHEIIAHIDVEATRLSPIVIGAAVSTADGYFSNFILRFWENIGNGFIDNDTKKEFHPDPSRIQMDIYIPEIIDNSVKGKIWDYYKTNEYKRGIISEGTFRGIEFRYKENKDGLTICDIPSAITASYNTVKDILHLSADEKSHDINAEERFLTKERDSFEFTLNKLMSEEALTSKLKTFPSYTDDKIEHILQVMKQVKIRSIKL